MKSVNANEVGHDALKHLKRLYAWVPPRRSTPIARKLKFCGFLSIIGLFFFFFGVWLINLLVAAMLVLGGLVLVVSGFFAQAGKSKLFPEGYDPYSDDPYDSSNSPHGHDAYGNRLECGQDSKRSY